MKIAIDIDDTIVNTSEVIVEYIKKLDKKYNDNLIDILNYDITNKVVNDFFDKYLEEIITSVSLKPSAVTTINKLYLNNQIYIITARSNKYINEVEILTQKLLKKYGISYHYLITSAGSKSEICKKNNIDLLIDDSIKHCTLAEEKGIKSILFNSIANKNYQTNIKRVSDWNEIYDIISSVQLSS